VREFLHQPVTHSVDRASEPVPDMTHHVFTVRKDDRTAVVQELAGGRGRTMFFTRTKHSARRLSRQLTSAGIPAAELHGNLSQGARDRNLGLFRDGGVRVLVATDIAARGIHVDDVALVVHVDPPAEHKAYMHRSGRTARAGAAGDVVTLVPPEQRDEVAKLTRKAGIKPKTADVGPGAHVITDLVGEAAPRVSAEERAAAEARTQPRPDSRPSGANAASGRPRRRGGRGNRSGGGGTGGGGGRSGGGRSGSSAAPSARAGAVSSRRSR
jgi:superfamily II DNA/RNA helicase